MNIDPNYQNFSSLYVGGILNAYKEHEANTSFLIDKKWSGLEMEASEKKEQAVPGGVGRNANDCITYDLENFRDGDEEEVEWQVP